MDYFKTVSKNSADVQKYLEYYFNYKLPNDQPITDEEIFGVLKDHLAPFPFSKFLRDLILKKFPDKFGVYDDDVSQTEAMIGFCTEAFRKSGITGQKNIFSKDKKVITSELLRKQIRNWFGSVMPSRESIFLLAFALGLDCSGLSELLTNGIHDKRLNFKNPAEVTAYACLDKNKSYSYAEKILDLAAKRAYAEQKNVKVVFTSEYEDLYGKNNTEEKLIGFIAELISEKCDPRFSTCINVCYNKLTEKIYKNAVADKIVSIANETGIEVPVSDKLSFGTVERYIYYYVPVKNDNGYYRTDTYAPYNNGNIVGRQNNYFKDSKWFFSTLLRRSDLKKMYEGKKTISRDTILTLAFFVICEENPGYDAYEYIMEINDYLYFCRFESFNFSYPYDLFIFMCLQTDDPLSCFRKIWRYSWIK